MTLTGKDEVYLDYQSARPVDPRVVEAMQPYFTQRFGIHLLCTRSATAPPRHSRQAGLLLQPSSVRLRKELCSPPVPLNLSTWHY